MNLESEHKGKYIVIALSEKLLKGDYDFDGTEISPPSHIFGIYGPFTKQRLAEAWKRESELSTNLNCEVRMLFEPIINVREAYIAIRSMIKAEEKENASSKDRT